MAGTISNLETGKKNQRNFREEIQSFGGSCPGRKKIMGTLITLWKSPQRPQDFFFFFLVKCLHIPKTSGNWINVNITSYKVEPQVK